MKSYGTFKEIYNFQLLPKKSRKSLALLKNSLSSFKFLKATLECVVIPRISL